MLFVKGGDSLAGRYFLHRLFPLTIGELATVPRRSLETLSGFPEPFTTGDESFYRRWAQTYRYQVIREDMKTAFDTVKNWLEILQNFYDWATVPDPAARFENLVAVHLLRAVTAWTEAGAGEFALHFIRDREKSNEESVGCSGGPACEHTRNLPASREQRRGDPGGLGGALAGGAAVMRGGDRAPASTSMLMLMHLRHGFL